MSESLNPINLLKEDLENDEIAIRVNAIHRLKIVATLISQDDIRTILLPFLDVLIKKEDDEVLFAIAEELGNLAAFLPGNQSILLPNLEFLCCVDETVVRDMAVKSLNVISKLLSDADIINKFIPMVMKLANNAENFTARVSAIHIMCQVYSRAGSSKEKIRQKFSDFSLEETPMVKRAIASKIGDFCKIIEKEFLLSETIQIFKQLANDEQDAVRVICLDNLRSFIETLSKEENKTHLVQIIIAATEDKAWRVRLSLAKNFPQLVEAYGKDITESSLIPIFTTLLKDSENEVKIAAISSLSQFIKTISTEKVVHLLSQIQVLAKDPNDQVRASTMDVIAEVVRIVNREASIQKLLPAITELFSDENPHVRNSVIKAATNLILEVGLDVIPSLAPHLKSAIEDSKWRVRMEALDGIVRIAQSLRNPDIFNKHFEGLYLHYLKDRAASVREMGQAKLKNLVEIFKVDWAFSMIVPRLNEILRLETGYLSKIAALYSFQSIFEAFPNDKEVSDKIIGILTKFSKDGNPNLKLVLCKIFKKIVQSGSISQSALSQIKMVLNELKSEKDRDVLFYAQDVFNA